MMSVIIINIATNDILLQTLSAINWPLNSLSLAKQ